MPANLTPAYLAAEAAYREAQTDEEKLACLERMLSVIPKHKGTEKMQAGIKRRIAALRHREGKARARRKAAGHLVDKQGAGQVTLLGGPNTGKSQLLAALTNAKAEIDQYPYTTQRALPGMMPYEDVQIQLVDLPAVDENFFMPWVSDMVRRADMSLIVADLGTDDALEQVQQVLDRMRSVRIALSREPPSDGPPEPAVVWRRAIIAANKCDLPGSRDRLQVLEDLLGDDFAIHPVSAVEGGGLEALRGVIFDSLGVIRLYSKVPGRPADMDDPFVLPNGSTVLDLARAVHKELADNLKQARVWGRGRYEGQPVSRDAVLSDGDVVELRE